MQELFRQLVQLATDPFAGPEVGEAIRIAVERAERQPQLAAGGAWDACDTCCDPGSDDHPPPGP